MTKDHSESGIVGEIQHGDTTIRITTRHILLLDADKKITKVFANRNIMRFIYVDGTWVYALQNESVGWDNELGG